MLTLMSLLEVQKYLCGTSNANAMIMAYITIVYILGVVVAYMSTLAYFYYYNNPCCLKENKLKYAEGEIVLYLTYIPFFSSWFYVIIFLIYLITKLLKYLSYKILELILR